MSIATVKDEGDWIYIYDENGHQTGTIYASAGEKLVGYTSTSVSTKDSSGWTYLYDEKGNRTKTVY